MVLEAIFNLKVPSGLTFYFDKDSKNNIFVGYIYPIFF